MCKPSQLRGKGRWFLNVTSMMQLRPRAIVIIVHRDSEFSIRSIKKHHCGKEFHNIYLLPEYEYAKNILAEIPRGPRVIDIRYESLSETSSWIRLFKFLRQTIHPTKNLTIAIPTFKNGNIPM